MANQKISGLPAAGALTGAELVEAVQGGVNVQTTTQDIADLGGSGGSWGSITGTLSNQTDLQTALNAKEDIATQADVTIANGVTALNMAAGDIQFLTITEAKVINSITNSFIGTVGFVIPGTFSVTFTTINATITGSYNSGEQNIIWVTCIDATGTPEYTITYENSLSDVNVTTIGALINGATSKTTPVDADQVGLMDSAASNVLKKLSWANIKATLKTYFDTLYNSVDRASTSTAGGTITLDFNSQKQRAFYGSASFSTPKTIAVSNATNIISFNFSFTITDVAAVLTLPASFVMNDVNFDGTDWTPPNTGNFLMGGYYDGTNYMVIIAGPFT